MICKECNFENKEGAAFCANCGKPIVAESASAMEPIPENEEKTTIIEPVAEEEAKPADDSEANTTVLTNNMPMSPVNPAPAPQGFAEGPKPAAPMGTPAPVAAPQGFAQGPKPATPMGAPMGAPMGQPPMNNMKPSQAPVNNAKPAQAPKAAKPAKAKKSKGTIAYIVISIILILGLAGVGTWGYFHYTDKLDKADEEKATLEANLTSEYEGQITDLESEISTLETTVSDYEAQVSDLELLVSSLQSDVDSYAPYYELINYVSSSVAQGSTTFFASNNIVHLTSGETAEIKVFYADLTGTVYYELMDSSVATCEWGDTWENEETTATLYITPVSSGYTTIEITNTTDDQVLEILVFVE